MHRPAAILFDFYNTLGVDRNPDDAVEAPILAEFGYQLDPAAVRAARASVQEQMSAVEAIDHSAHSGSREDYNEYLRTLNTPWLEAAGVDPFHPGCFERLCDAWDDPSRICLFDDTLPALAELRERGYRLGLVSNWSWGLQDVLDCTGLASLLEVAVISARAGYRKPHAAIYRTALEALDLPARSVLFVGDDPLADVEGPLAAGLTPVHIDRFDAYTTHPGVERIRTLDELLTLLA
jgi:putative hydrolase of the HAD superfamily